MKDVRKLFKKLGGILILGMSFLLLAGCSSSKSSSKNSASVYNRVKRTNTVVWGVKYDTALFGIKSVKTNKLEGFEIDLARLLTKKILGKNGKTEFIEVNASSKVPQLKNGNIDAVLATMTITPERAKVIDFSTPYFKAGTSLLVKKSSGIKSIKDLNNPNKKIIIEKGTTAEADVKKYAPKAKIRQFGDYGACTNALLAGQGDAMATDNGILAGIAKEHKELQLVGGVIAIEPYGIAVDKGQSKMLKAINKALKDVKADGSYHRLMKKWFGNIEGFNIKEAEY